MKKVHGQYRISRKNLYFDLKEIVSSLQNRNAFILTDIDFGASYLARYLDELSVNTVTISCSGKSNYEDVCKITEEFRLSDSSIIIGVGSDSVIKAAKAVKLFSCMSTETPYFEQLPAQASVKMISVPTTIAGITNSANNLLCIEADENGGCRRIKDSEAMPEYLLLDNKLISYSSKNQKNEEMAGLLGCAANMLWSSEYDSTVFQLCAEAYQILYDNLLPFLRDEKDSLHMMQEAAFDIGWAAGKCGHLAIDSFVTQAAALCGVSFEKASLLVQAPLSLAIAERFVRKGISSFNEEALENREVIVEELLNDEEKELYSKMRTMADTVAYGAHRVKVLSKQLSFLSQILEISPETDPDDLTVKKCAEEVDSSSFEGWPTLYDQDELEFILFQLFHRVRVGYFTEICARKPNRYSRILEETSIQYEDDFSEDRIIPDPFYVRREQRSKMVDGLQKLTLETLVLTRDFLNENGLRFYLSEGTLLGAVRHRGFIPWDDDVDIMMPREDYDALVQLSAEGKVPPELNFDALENNPKHWVLGAKMQLTRPTNYIQRKVEKLSPYCGPYVDVFPLDYWNRPHTKKEYRSQRIVKMCRRLLFMKTGYSTVTKGKFHRILMRIAVPFIPQKFIARMAVRNMKKFFDKKRKYFVHLCSYYPYYKEVFPVGMFGEPLLMDFEGYEMPVPQEYDYMLRTIYGNSYDSVPPQSVTRMRRHAFELVDNDEVVEDDD